MAGADAEIQTGQRVTRWAMPPAVGRRASGAGPRILPKTANGYTVPVSLFPSIRPSPPVLPSGRSPNVS